VVVVERPPDPEVIGRPPGVLAPPAARSRFDSLISAAAEATGVEGALLHAVISVESAYSPSAISKRGATGLMQLMPATARQYGTPDAFDPGQNINGGARYLKYLLKKYGDRIELVLAAYNAGESTVERYGGKVPPFKETVEYIDKVTRRYAELRQAPR
jgi:soluble lytic murein transglycosylase-like protein